MEVHRIVYLYQRWKERTLTPTEAQEFRLLLRDERAEQVLKNHWGATWEGLSPEDLKATSIQHYESIYQRIAGLSPRARRRSIWISRVGIAACILGFLFLGYLLYQNRAQRIPLDRWAATNDIAPGGQRATLSLGDGRVISLSEAKQGIIVGDGLLYSDSSSIETAVSGEALASVQQATLRTPKGGQYQVTLPDGTRVWLNATTSLTYPISFSGAAQRRVTLEGEAYFEVAPDNQHPFIVTTEKQEVQVLGTHFNIRAFPEEKETRTTLIEGLVEVRPLFTNARDTAPRSLRILPSEQSVLSDRQFSKQVVNVEQAIAWKNGYFLFEDEGIESIMQKIEQWYDVDVYYAYGKVTDEGFNGMIARDKPISEVLRMLEETDAVHFRIKDKEVYVYP